MDLSAIQADLQRKIHKARPVVTMVESGELKVLSEAEQRQVSMYPSWLAALEEVKAGRMPNLQQPSNNASSPDSAKVRGAPSDVSNIENASTTSESSDTFLLSVFRSVAGEIRADEDQSPKRRKALIDAQVKSLVSTKQLTSATKEFDRVSELRTDIRSGRIERPSKSQLSKVQTFDVLKREVQQWKEYVKQQQDKVRRGIEEAIRKLDLGIVDEVTEEGARADESVAECDVQSETSSASSPEHASVADVSVDATDIKEDIVVEEIALEVAAPEPAPPVVPTAESSDEEEEEEDVPAGDDEDDDDMFGGLDSVFSVSKQKKAAKKAKVESAPTPVAKPVEVAVEVAQVADDEEERQESDEVVDADVPPVRKEIDWSKLKYKKNRRSLADVQAELEYNAEKRNALAAAAVAARVAAEKLNEFLYLDVSSKVPSRATTSKAGHRVESPTSAGSAGFARAQKELQIALQDPIPFVRVASLNDNASVWCVNVSPAEGPLAGCIIPLRLTFPLLYPLLPPVLTSLVDLPHPQCLNSAGGHRNVLSLPLTTPEGWDAAVGVQAILSQLGSLFDDQHFLKAKKSFNNFEAKIRFARRDCSRFVAVDGSSHCPDAPFPAISLWNGPFVPAPKKVQSGGFIAGPATLAWGHRFVQPGSAAAAFGLEVKGQSESIRIELDAFSSLQGPKCCTLVVCPYKGTAQWSFEAEDTSEDKITFAPLVQPHDGVWIALDFTSATCRLWATGATAWEASIPLKTGVVAIRPTIVIEDKASLRCAFHINEPLSTFGAITPPVAQGSPSTKQVAASPTGELPLCCFVSMATQAESVLGPHVEVVKRIKGGFIPVEVHCSVDEMLSVNAVEQVRNKPKLLGGRRIDGVIPLCLDVNNAKRALPDVKKHLMRLARNPDASTLYEPPFRTPSALLILPAAMNDVVKHIAKAIGTTKVNIQQVERLVRLYTQLLHTFAAVIADTWAAASNDLESLAASPPSSGHVLAWSHILGTSWPEVLRAALHADGVALVASEETFNAFNKTKRTCFLIGAALTRAMRTTSIQRLAEDLGSRGGNPCDDVLRDTVPSLCASLNHITTWDALEEWVGVSFM